MELYNIKNNALEQIKRAPFKFEREIQYIVEGNVYELFDLEFVSTEFTIGDFRIDSLCYDNENNCFVIIEYKKGNSYSVVDQGYSYLSVMLNNKAEFILEYNEAKNKQLKRDDVEWSQSRAVFISQSFNNYQKNSVNFKDIPFELWEIKRYSNNTISLLQHNSNSKESINKVSGGKNKVIEDVSKQVKVLSDEDTLNGKKVSENIKELYYQLKERLLDWDEVSTSSKTHYVSFKRGKRVFAYFNFRKSYIRVHLLGHLKTKWDGSKDSKEPTNKFTLDDPKKMFEIWENDYKALYSYDIKDDKDFDYFLLMVKQKYDSVG
jgi:hypothetical protein